MKPLLLVAAVLTASLISSVTISAQAPPSVSVILETSVQDGATPTVTLRWPAEAQAVEDSFGRK
ncbi:MAG: hypothetical protein ACKOB6_01580, partial [Candidatus Kapaibacterium sp.]